METSQVVLIIFVVLIISSTLLAIFGPPVIPTPPQKIIIERNDIPFVFGAPRRFYSPRYPLVWRRRWGRV